MTAKHLALAYNALAHPRRVRLFTLLLENPTAGDSILALQLASKIPHAPLVHHLRVMEKGGLVQRQRKGAEVTIRLRRQDWFSTVRTAARQPGQASGVVA